MEMTREQRMTEGKKVIFAVLGTLIFSFGLNFFVVPMGLYNGGFVGIGQVIQTILFRYTSLEPGSVDIAGILYFLFNIPVFILAFHSLGRGFFIKTVICVISQSIFLTLIPSPEVPVITDTLTACFVGGSIAGWGVGLTLKNGACCGGTDVLGVYFTKKLKHFSVGRLGLMVNVCIYIACALLFDLSIMIYSIIYYLILSFMMDRTHSQNIAMEVDIYTKDKTEEITQVVVERMARGCTYWDAKGALTESKTSIICVVVSKYEVTQLLRYVNAIDEDAFIVLKGAVSVEGNFFKKL